VIELYHRIHVREKFSTHSHLRRFHTPVKRRRPSYG